jgi:hypothetical protein
VRLKRRLAAIEQEMDAHANIDLEAQVNAYMADLQAGIEELKNAAPKAPEERHHFFLLKKRMVDMVVVEATIDGNRDIHVKFRVDFNNLAEGNVVSDKKAPDLPNESDSRTQHHLIMAKSSFGCSERLSKCEFFASYNIKSALKIHQQDVDFQGAGSTCQKHTPRPWKRGECGVMVYEKFFHSRTPVTPLYIEFCVDF